MTHKVFVSYHHGKDQSRANYLRSTYGSDNTLIDRSLQDKYDSESDDVILQLIRTNHLKESTVTIVLVGDETSKRKWVDWEVYSSLRPYGDRSVNGLLAIYFPGKDYDDAPARLRDNLDSGYAVAMKWENISWQLSDKIDEAYNNRSRTELIKNWRNRRERNS